MLGLAVPRPSQSGAGDKPWRCNVLVAPVPPPFFFFFLFSFFSRSFSSSAAEVD